eukprot:g3048.t1
MSTEDEIALLTAEINAFALSHGWFPLDKSEQVWTTWKRVRKPTPITTQSTNPKRKETLLRPIWEQCATILNEILQNRNAYVFSRPVDPVRDRVPNYFDVVKNPMDLGTVQERLDLQARRRNEPMKSYMYRCPLELLSDVEQVWENCFLYNPPGYEVRKMGEILKSEFDLRWKAMKIEESVHRINKQFGSEEVLGLSTQDRPVGKEDIHEVAHSNKIQKKRKPGFVSKERQPNTNPKPRVKKEGESRISPPKALVENPPAPHDPQSKKKKKKTSVSQTTKPDKGTGKSEVKEKNNGVRKDGDKKSTTQMKKSNKSVGENKMRRLIQSCQQPSKKPDHQLESQSTQREWLPPIERGGGLQAATKNKTQSIKPPPPPPPPQDFSKAIKDKTQNKESVLNQMTAVNDEVKKSLKGLASKSESEMTDFEVRRKLSQLLENVSMNAIQILSKNVLSKDPSFASGESNLDLLEIKYVRSAVRTLLSARAKQRKEKASLAAKTKQVPSIKDETSPVSVQTSKKKRRVEDEGTPLTTKTPRVSSPSPPWDRGLTHNRTVWENAVDFCGITPRLNGEGLGLTPRQESDGSNWEEAVPDDVEEGEIRN